MRTKENQGITLISLVVTIIIILIIAGVTVNTLTGENSIIEKTKSAMDNMNRAGKLELVKLAIQNAFIQGYTEINIDQLKKSIQEEGLTVEEIGLTATSLPASINIDGMHYIINSNGEMEPGNITVFGKEKNINKYGNKVTYTSKVGYTGSWRLFYQTDKYTYLIADRFTEAVKPYTTTSGNQEKYSIVVNGDSISNPFDSISNKAKEFNPTLFLQQYQLFYPDNNEDLIVNMKSLAWECDTEVWSKYLRENPVEGEYAICGPSIELFIASYNATAFSNNKDELKFGTAHWGYTPSYFSKDSLIKDNEIKNYGYVNPLNNGIYMYASWSSWWLASPSNYATACGIIVHTDYRSLGPADEKQYPFQFRPLISIPTSNFDETLIENS